MACSTITTLSSLLVVVVVVVLVALSTHHIVEATTIYEILPRYGLPSGIFPDSVDSYTFNPEDGSFEVELGKQPCYVHLDKYVISYEERLSGNLKLGSITNLKGVKMKSFLIWLDVDEIKVDLPPHDLVYFEVGFVNKKLDADQFQTIHSCSSTKKRLHNVHPLFLPL